ncbi:UNKNOWN [Stylonychia lemnae]|uniref:Transmembrane protein n=1 Tax=Stylonychia lemnae TaxID=5949 RepID=A0A078AK85_STYLE|nr:UNKNOWN [Stylonychia lemnae]|eukprot:CDW82306.1 UNKNOWN [Stylonychia lemnae]
MMNLYTFLLILTDWGTQNQLRFSLMFLHLIAPFYTVLLAINIYEVQKWLYFLNQPVVFVSYLLLIAEVTTLCIGYLQYIRIESSFMNIFQNYIISNTVAVFLPYIFQVALMQYTIKQAQRQLGSDAILSTDRRTVSSEIRLKQQFNVEQKFGIIRKIFEDKQIMNPINPEEIFTCQDLIDDYKVCRKEKRFQTQKKQNIRRCFDYRTMAFKCFMMQEEDFVDLIIEKYEEKQRLNKFLEDEGSVLAPSFKEKNQVFRIRNVTGQEMQ